MVVMRPNMKHDCDIKLRELHRGDNSASKVFETSGIKYTFVKHQRWLSQLVFIPELGSVSSLSEVSPKDSDQNHIVSVYLLVLETSHGI